MNDLLYQNHSDTSRQAAERNVSAKKQRVMILDYIIHCGINGAIGDELAENFYIVPGTVSARLRDLELEGLIVKTDLKRKTRCNRQANVYVCKNIFRLMPFQRDAVKPCTELQRLRNENEELKRIILKLESQKDEH